jgi:hypothetical protein
MILCCLAQPLTAQAEQQQGSNLLSRLGKQLAMHMCEPILPAAYLEL